MLRGLYTTFTFQFLVMYQTELAQVSHTQLMLTGGWITISRSGLYLQSTISLLKGYYKPYKVTYYSEDGCIVQPIKCICRTKQNTARFQCSKFKQDDRKYGMQIFYAGGRHTKRGRHLFMANSCFCILKHIKQVSDCCMRHLQLNWCVLIHSKYRWAVNRTVVNFD